LLDNFTSISFIDNAHIIGDASDTFAWTKLFEARWLVWFDARWSWVSCGRSLLFGACVVH